MRSTWPAWFALALAACSTTPVTNSAVSCVVEAAATPSEARVGDAVTLTGGPFTAAYDTVVRVGGVDADVLDVARAGCDVCDVCRADASCSACGACDACVDACATCAQTVEVVVPAVDPGPRAVVMVNRYGATAPVPFTVLEPADTDTEVPLDSDVAP